MTVPWISIPLAIVLGMADEPEAVQPPTMEQLVRRSGCYECHQVDRKKVGPAFEQIAGRYKEESGARDALVEKVKKGGKGNWTKLTGGVPMPPHSPRLTDSEITRLVDWLLGLSTTDTQPKQ